MFYVFDVDMTLAESDCMMTEEHAEIFRKWCAGKTFFLCSGSQMDKMKQQVPADILAQAKALFPCVGCELWENGKKVRGHNFSWPEGLREKLEEFLKASTYPTEKRTADFIQDRESMVCFSIVGKSAEGEQRHAYTAFDNVEGERERMASELRELFPMLEISIGGQVSMDISDKGMNKSQVLPVMRELYGNEPITFFGDRMNEGGNDYPLAEAMRIESKQNVTVPVTTYGDTMEKLKAMSTESAA